MSGCHICGRCRTADETQRDGAWHHADCWDGRAAQLKHARDYEQACVAVLEANPHRLEEEPAKPGCSCGGTCNTCRIIAQYATKPPKAPWRLLPMEAMPYVLEALALGAHKYSKIGECSCESATNATDPTGQRGSAKSATDDTCSEQIQNTKPSKTRTPGNGQPRTQVEHERNTHDARPSTTQQRGPSTDEKNCMGYLRPNTQRLSETGATFVAHGIDSTSTTVTARTSFEDAFACHATSDSDSSRERVDGFREHYPTCGTRRVVSGADSWKQRPDTDDWEAAMRHMSWLAVGTELDAEGPHHAACVIARMLFILAKYDERKKKT